MIRALLLTLAVLCALSQPSGAVNQLCCSTMPPGTVVGNPSPQADQIAPHSQAAMQEGMIAVLKAAVMTVTTDQAFAMLSPPPKYRVTAIFATNCTVSPSGDAGGIYTAASKGGTAVVTAAQTYTSLASATAVQDLTNNVSAQTLAATQLYLSLTTATTGGPCDFYVYAKGVP